MINQPYRSLRSHLDHCSSFQFLGVRYSKHYLLSPPPVSARFIGLACSTSGCNCMSQQIKKYSILHQFWYSNLEAVPIFKREQLIHVKNKIKFWNKYIPRRIPILMLSAQTNGLPQLNAIQYLPANISPVLTVINQQLSTILLCRHGLPYLSVRALL